jgi:hypothetical protein
MKSRQQSAALQTLWKAESVRSKPRRNLADAFMKALADDWKAPRSTEQAKREKRAGLVQQEFRELTDEERVKARVEFAGIKAKLEGQ